MQPQDSYVQREELQETLKSYPNVFANIAGHNHHHAITPIGEGEHGFWQIQTASLLDYPQQSRVLKSFTKATASARSIRAQWTIIQRRIRLPLIRGSLPISIRRKTAKGQPGKRPARQKTATRSYDSPSQRRLLKNFDRTRLGAELRLCALVAPCQEPKLQNQMSNLFNSGA